MYTAMSAKNGLGQTLPLIHACKKYSSDIAVILSVGCRRKYTSGPGCGVGKGGGGGGSIKEAGGAFGRLGTAKEESYFYKKQKEDIEKIKKDLAKILRLTEEQVRQNKRGKPKSPK